jgi:D-serine deaminase-like pyridoxal phosphate-dependent protein
MDLRSIPTPALVLDLARARRNAVRVAAIAAGAGVRLRPHVKTHKCVELARLQTAGQFGGITVSTLAEARAFGAAGFRDQIYAVPIEPGKFDEVADLHTAGVDLAVITDDPGALPALDRVCAARGVRVPVLLEVDCGDARTGVSPDDPGAASTCRAILAAPHLRFAGLLTHAGHSYDARDPAARARIAAEECSAIVGLSRRLRADGIEVPALSVGSTPTVTAAPDLGGVTEIRPGNYLLFDGFQSALGTCAPEDCALTVLAAVVSRSTARRAVVIDAGAIALSKDRGAARWDPAAGYGEVLDCEGRRLGLTVTDVSQEHGQVGSVPGSLLHALPVGTRVRVRVNHACLAAVQHQCFHVLEDGRVVDRWRIHRGWH